MPDDLPFGNPYEGYVSYEDDDQPWAGALTTGETQTEVFRDVVEAVRQRIQQQRLLTADELDHPTTEVEEKVQQVALQLVKQHNQTAPNDGVPLLDGEPETLARRIVDEVLGWGPLSPYMKNDEVEEVILNDYDRGFVIYADGRKEKIPGFHSAEFARAFFNRKIEAGHGYPVNSKNPYQDARLPDGSRLFVQIPPLAGTDLQVTIRRFRPVAMDLAELIELGTITPALRNFFRAVAQAHRTLVVAGGTGTGKTTFLQAISRDFPEGDRVVTIEDTPELQLGHLPDWSMSYVRHAAEGIEAIGMDQLIRNALRQRPTRIVLGEARGGEMVDILTACNTGHDGTLFTVHANSVRETVDRMVTMYRMGRDLAPEEVRKEIVSAIHFIVHLKREQSGLRYVAGVGEIRRLEGNNVVVEPIFKSPGQGQVAQFEMYPRATEFLEAQVPGFDFERDVVQRNGADTRQSQVLGQRGGVR
jgi:pilus assembly protein CpaF